MPNDMTPNEIKAELTDNERERYEHAVNLVNDCNVILDDNMTDDQVWDILVNKLGYKDMTELWAWRLKKCFESLAFALKENRELKAERDRMQGLISINEKLNLKIIRLERELQEATAVKKAGQ